LSAKKSANNKERRQKLYAAGAAEKDVKVCTLADNLLCTRPSGTFYQK